MLSRNIKVDEAKNYLRDKIKHFFLNDVHKISLVKQQKIIKIKVAIDAIDPLMWLSQQKWEQKIYWSDRQGKFSIAGLGVTDLVKGNKFICYQALFTRLRKHLSTSYSQVRYYGGISFINKQINTSPWQEFGNYRFLVPKFEVYTDESGTYFACNILPNCETSYNVQLSQILIELNKIVFEPIDSQKLMPQCVSRLDIPNKLRWYRNIKSALASFDKGETAKIVLARQSNFNFLDPWQPENLLSLLQENNHQVFHFFFQPNPGKAFLGITPERLYYRQERLIKTEAIAGTRGRGKSTQEDQQLANDLLTSAKDMREHKLVVHSLNDALNQLCNFVEVSAKPNLLQLHQVQHLHTSCYGFLQEEVGDGEIIQQLHPTPAVGGYPKQQALEAIEAIEPFERGWYAAPVGWVGHDSAEFAVAIRSGLIVENKLTLFAGAGIVPGSQPESEWEELENKIRNFRNIFDFVGKEVTQNNFVVAS